MAMKMRQSLAQLEQEFRQEMQVETGRAERLRSDAVRRSRVRHRHRARQRSSLRYWVLVLSLVLTAVVVTAVMFETLYLLLG